MYVRFDSISHWRLFCVKHNPYTNSVFIRSVVDIAVVYLHFTLFESLLNANVRSFVLISFAFAKRMLLVIVNTKYNIHHNRIYCG